MSQVIHLENNTAWMELSDSSKAFAMTNLTIQETCKRNVS